MLSNQFIDTYRHKGLRIKLVIELTRKGITDKNVLQAIKKIPRHYFMDTTFVKFAYEDNAFPIAAGQTISQPYTVAFQTQLLQINKGEKVLEIGTGSGYQTCVLLEMGARVFTVERQRILFDKTKTVLPLMNYHPKFFYGDGYQGLAAFAPFNKILVTAGAPFVPEELKKQLKVGGILVIPVGEEVQTMISIGKISENEFSETQHGDFRFVPLVSEKAQ
ncbi:MAG: protein-L-isoaspartate(D-aspartate) O-methyltransferase [Bacteroidota bacterium]